MSGMFGKGGAQSQQSNVANGIQVQTSVYGTVLPIVYGTNRVAGNMLWYGNFQATPDTSQSSAGGKSGGSPASGSYTYSAALAVGLCEGPIQGIGLIWESKNLHDMADLGFTLMNGNPGSGTPPLQSPWAYLTANFPGQDLVYPNIAYVVNADFALGTSADLPNLTFEVQGMEIVSGAADANPRDILYSLFTNGVFGLAIPTSQIGDWSQFSNAMMANLLLFSPVIDTQTTMQQLVTDMLAAANCDIFWSESVVKIVPYWDSPATSGYGTFTPNTTPVYSLDDDDFIYSEGDDPVQIQRSSIADAYNDIQVQFRHRENFYNVETAEAKDQYYCSLYGVLTDSTRDYEFICEQGMAQQVAQILLQRSVYIRNTYTFTLGWAFCALEPMDLVTLTDPRLGLNNTPVRITRIDEDDNGELQITAEEYPAGIATPAAYNASGGGSGYSPNYAVAAPNVTNAVIFEPPAELTSNTLEIWLGATGEGQENWAGCNVWASWDGDVYENIGTINGGSRIGVTTTGLPIVADPDTTDTLGVDLTVSEGSLLSGSQADADAFRTLCYVGGSTGGAGELISYETATLTTQFNYNLTYLRRGAYGSNIGLHNTGVQFMRLDQAILKLEYNQAYIGQPVYIKFQSFNQFGGGIQTLAEVPAYTYNIQGSAYTSALPDVQNLTTNFIAGLTQIYWDAVVDFRTPIDYEIRLGPSWGSGKVIGRTPNTSIPSQGDGQYWVAAHYYPISGGFDIYSPDPVSIEITGSTLLANVVDTFDQAALGWPGTVTGSAIVNTMQDWLQLQGTGNLLAEANILADSDILNLGGLGLSGSYALPPSETVDVGYVASCSVVISYTAYGLSIFDNLLVDANLLAVPDLLDAALGGDITVTPQIAVAPASGIFGAWQNFKPGVYSGQYFKAQVLITTDNPQINAVVTEFVFTVNVPNRIDTFNNVPVAAVGSTLSYATPFNGGPNATSAPLTQITVLNAQQGDTVVLSSQTLTSFTVQVLNGGVGVARNINATSQGY